MRLINLYIDNLKMLDEFLKIIYSFTDEIIFLKNSLIFY